MMQRQAFVVAPLAGALMVLGFAPFSLPIAVLPAPTFALAVLLWLVTTPTLTRRQGFALGYAFGLGHFLAGVSWIYVSLAEFSGLPAPAAAAATVALCAYLALFPGLALFGYVHWRRAESGARNALLFAALWTITEWLRGTLFTGLPWLAVGYAHTPPSPLGGFAAGFGVYGVGFACALLAGFLLNLIQQHGRARLGAAVGAIVILGLGTVLSAMRWTDPAGPPLRVALLQGDVPQSLKWDPARLQLSYDRYLTLAAQGPEKAADLTVLPETALPLLFGSIPAGILTQLTARGDVLLGAAAEVGPRQYINAAIALPKGMNGDAQFFAKQHLVPFGEFAPPGFRWFFDQLRIPMSDFSPGAARQAPLAIGGAHVAPNICYEDVFGEELLPALRDADLLINLSNTAWFGRSLAQPQHLQIAQLRAMETGRTMLRATNSGMTAMILPNGEVASQLAPFTVGRLDVEAQRYTGLTPYAKWGNALILAIALINIALARRKRR